MRILIISNLVSYTVNFRKEIITKLIDNGCEIKILADNDSLKKFDELKRIGCKFKQVNFNGKGKNIIEELAMLFSYIREIREYKPDYVLTFTIKPNLYGGIASKINGTKYIPMITGLGELEKQSRLRWLLLLLHRLTMPYASCVFFQNEDNIYFFKNERIECKKYKLLPGSGINLTKFTYKEYPKMESKIIFGFVGRLIKEKGINEFLEAAMHFSENENILFYVAGKCDDTLKVQIKDLNNRGVICYFGILEDTRIIYEKIHCLVLPTYHPEGISNVLLEACATGRPCICTSRPGCKEVIENGYNGIYCIEKDSDNLIQTIKEFISFPKEKRKMMGENARKLVEERFNRKIVVEEYIHELLS